MSGYPDWAQTPQAEFFSYFPEEGYCEFLEDIKDIIIERLTGSDRIG